MSERVCLYCGKPLVRRDREGQQKWMMRAFCNRSCSANATFQHGTGQKKPANQTNFYLTGQCECGVAAVHVRYVRILNGQGREQVVPLELCDACLLLAEDTYPEPPPIHKGVCFGWLPVRSTESVTNDDDRIALRPYPKTARFITVRNGRRLR